MPKILRNKSSTDLDYPICRPSLDLDFTQEVLDERITFSRGSIGTRVNRNRLIETVAANQPRFDYDPVTGECKGLLIEESRQNLIINSEDFGNASWGKFTSSIQTNIITAPDGNTTADKMVVTLAGTGGGYVIRDLSITSGTTYTASCFVKAAEFSSFAFVFQSNAFGSNLFARFNLSTGTLGTIDAGVTASIQAFPNGWYRCIATATATSTISSGVQFRVSLRGDGTSGIYIWGAQLETGAFPTSYIPTTASTVTRSADLVDMTGTNFSSWYNQTEGTIYTNNRIPYIPNPNVSLYFLIFGINVGNRHSIEQTTANGLTYITQNSGGIQYWSTSGSGVLPVNTNRKTTYAYASSNNTTMLAATSNQTYNFSQRSSRTDVYKSMTTLYLGRFGNSLYFLNGTIARFTYYPKKLKDNQLLYLTQ